MKVYDDIEEMLCDELNEIAKKKELTSSNLGVINTAIDVLKDISTIRVMEQEYGHGEDGYSKDSGYSNGYYNRYPFYMYDEAPGNSYARDRNAKRDSMGRYSRDGHDDYSNDTADQLRQMMDRAKDDREREVLRNAMNSMKNM